MASVNFALSFPTIALPDSQRNGDRIMVFMMTCMASISKLIAKTIPSFLTQVAQLNVLLNFLEHSSINNLITENLQSPRAQTDVNAK